MGDQLTIKIAQLWWLHKEQKAAFKGTMSEEVSKELRDICGKGYLISTLCMNEILVIYNSVKSPLEDISLSSGGNESDQGPSANEGGTPEEFSRKTTQYLRVKQRKLLRAYLGVTSYIESVGQNIRVLTDHISMLKRTIRRLDNTGVSTPD